MGTVAPGLLSEVYSCIGLNTISGQIKSAPVKDISDKHYWAKQYKRNTRMLATPRGRSRDAYASLQSLNG